MNPRPAILLLLAAGCAALAGCAEFGRSRSTHATSVIKFLYPNDSQHIEAPGIPTLSLPLRVGVAFVPDSGMGSGALSEAAKSELLTHVAAEFKGLPYVKSIEVIPSGYLRPAGGFENLNELKELFGVDVVALVSYDQIQFTHEGVLSLAYWTIVGAWVVQGEKNDTQTLMDAVVFDIASRKLLFRAPGTSSVKASATPVNLSEELHKDSLTGFSEATNQMIANLKVELENFRVRVKESPGEYHIEHKEGYTGGGRLGALESLGLSALALVALLRRTPWKKARGAFPG